MRKFDFWCVRHPVAARCLFIAGGCGLATALLILFHGPVAVTVAVTVAVDLLLALAGFAFPDSCLNRLIQKAVARLHENCDPYPLLETAKQLLPYCKGPNGQAVEINYCVALRNLERNEEVYSRLAALAIDRYTGMLPITKFVYYNNLADVCFALEKVEEAAEAQKKAGMFYNDLKNKKQKEALNNAVVLLEATACYSRREYGAALQAAAGIKPENWCQAVDRALLMARCNRALGNHREAREGLEFVRQYGNRMAAVQLAARLSEEWI